MFYLLSIDCISGMCVLGFHLSLFIIILIIAIINKYFLLFIVLCKAL